MRAEIGRFDGEMKLIHFNEGDTIAVLMSKAGFSVGNGESVNNEQGEEVSLSSQAQENGVYYIVGNFKQG